jgi:iron complex outermembrane receptor protein
MRYSLLVILLTLLGFGVAAQSIDTISGASFDSIATIKGSIPPSKIFKERVIRIAENPAYQTSQLDELLSQESALHLRQYGPGQLTSISMRGASAAQTNVYWNGVLLNSPMLGQADLSVVPLIGVDEAAIRYGYANQRDGFGGLGGSILLSSNSHETPVSFTLGMASYSDYSVGVISNYQIKKWRLKSGVSYRSAENDFEFSNIAKPDYPTETRKHNSFLQYTFQQHAWYTAKNGGEWSAHGLYTAADRDIPNAISSQVPSDQTQEDQTALITVAYQKHYTNWFFKTQAAYRFIELNYENPQSNIHSNSTMHGLQWTNYASRYIGNRNKIEANLLLTVDQAFASTYAEEIRSQGRLGIQYTRLVGDNWRIYAGVQPEFVDDTVIAALPVLGITRDLWNNHMTIKANVARIMRYPTLNDLYWNPGGNANLKPELGWNSELGIALNEQLDSWLFNAEVTGFIGAIDEWILWIPNEEGFSEVQNVEEVDQKGVELNLRVKKQLNTNWSIGFKGDYTFVQSTDQNGNQLIYTPENELNYQVTVGYKKWIFKGIYHFTDERYTTSNNTWFLPAYDLVDLILGYQVKSQLKWEGMVQLQVSNILEKSYMSLAGRPMPGRVYQLSIQLRRK